MDKLEGIKCGDLVRRSEHWYQVHPRDPRGQLGIVTGVEFYDYTGVLVTWPVVFWQGAVMESLVHPDNVDLVNNSEFQKNLKRRR